MNYCIITVGIRNFQDTFKTRKRSFISAFSICINVPLKGTDTCNLADDQICAFSLQTEAVSEKIGHNS